jgi:hypothetical protein
MKLELYIIRYGSKLQLEELEYPDVCTAVIWALPEEIRCRISSIGPCWTSGHGIENIELRFSAGTFVVSECCSSIKVPYFMPSSGNAALLYWQIKRYAQTGIWIEPREAHFSGSLAFRRPHSVAERAEMFFLISASPLIFPTIIIADKISKAMRRVVGRLKGALRRALPTRAPARARGGARGAAAAPPRGRRGARRRTWQDIK